MSLGHQTDLRRVRAALPLLLSSVCLACGESGGAPQDTVQPVWITEAEHQFGDAPEQDVFFIVPYVRSDLTGDGVLVLYTDRPASVTQPAHPPTSQIRRMYRSGAASTSRKSSTPSSSSYATSRSGESSKL